MRALGLATLFASLALALGACGPGSSSDAGADSGSHGGSKPTCTRIYTACHELDTGSGTPHECHEFAEASSSTEEACQAREAMCIAACPARADGGASAADASAADGGSPGADASSDGG